jgi:hypothetical protein
MKVGVTMVRDCELGSVESLGALLGCRCFTDRASNARSRIIWGGGDSLYRNPNFVKRLCATKWCKCMCALALCAPANETDVEALENGSFEPISNCSIYTRGTANGFHICGLMQTFLSFCSESSPATTSTLPVVLWSASRRLHGAGSVSATTEKVQKLSNFSIGGVQRGGGSTPSLRAALLIL